MPPLELHIPRQIKAGRKVTETVVSRNSEKKEASSARQLNLSNVRDLTCQDRQARTVGVKTARSPIPFGDRAHHQLRQVWRPRGSSAPL